MESLRVITQKSRGSGQEKGGVDKDEEGERSKDERKERADVEKQPRTQWRRIY